MSFPRYPKYKDSGVEWLGEVPAHWDVRRVRWLFEIRKRIAEQLGFDVFSITQEGFRVKDVESNEGQMAQDYSKYQFVEPGEFAMNHMDLITGGVDIASARGVTSPDYRVVRIRDSEVAFDRYFLRAFQMCFRQRIFYAYGQGSSQLGRWRLPTDQFKDFVFPVPPQHEQTAIAGFLDRETAKIDELVAEQRRLMELLKEKRQAVISHAVTRGLNHAAPLKPSGIEWLGDVPDHWQHTAVRHLVEEHKQGFYTKDEYVDEGTKLLRITDIRDDTSIDFGNCPKLAISEGEREQFGLSIGDFVFVRSGASIGKFGIVEEVTDAIFGSYTIRFTFRKTIDRRFLKWAFQSRGFLDGLFSSLHGGAIVNVNADNIKDQVLTIPPITEQEAIATYLEEQTSQFGVLMVEAQRAIDLLQERRTALISAAVTGQIDVRNVT